MNNSWFIFKKNKKILEKSNKYILKEGDIFKLGRIIFRVKDINLNKSKEKYNSDDDYLVKNILTEKTNNIENNKNNINLFKIKKNKNICRICYGDEDEENNPLIQPCSCSGTMKFIHYECLKHWIETQSCIKIEKNHLYTIFILKNLECELCKNKFPDVIQYNNKLLNISNFNYCYDKYLILESLVFDGKKNKFLYVINLENDNLKLRIGRGKEIDILITDISVSRVHCILTKDKNNIYIEDNNSKFGTLILNQSPFLKISSELPLNIQIGRTFFNIKMKKSFKLFSCCYCDEMSNDFYYYKQNQEKINYQKNIIIKKDNNYKDDESDKSINEEKDLVINLDNNIKKHYKNSTAISLEMSENNNNNDNNHEDKSRNNIKSIPFITSDTHAI